MNEITRVTSRDQLRAIARQLGVRPDWHEPEEQAVTARIGGSDLDNAGFWGRAYAGQTGRRELWVELSQGGKPVAEVNLATLLAWAAETDPGPGMTRAPGLVAQGSARDITYAGLEKIEEYWNARLTRGAAQAVHTGMAAHDGWKPHSHEVRPDHTGVERAGPDDPAGPRYDSTQALRYAASMLRTLASERPEDLLGNPFLLAARRLDKAAEDPGNNHGQETRPCR